VAVEGLGDHPELDDEVAGEVLRFDLATLLPPEAEQRGLVVPMMVRASEPPMKYRWRSAGKVSAALSNIASSHA